MFRCVWDNLVALQHSMQNEPNWCKSSCHKIAPEFHNERTRSTRLDCKLIFWCVLYYLGAFGTVWLHYKNRCKRAELVQKFVPPSRVEIFHNERTGSIPLDPKQMFWCVSYYLVAFWTVWLPYKTRCKTGRTSAKVRAMKLCRNFSQ